MGEGDVTGGLMCEGALEGGNAHEAFEKMDEIYVDNFKKLAGEYKKKEGEKTCPIRLAPAVFFKGNAPQHHRFSEKKIPDHITYAYQKDVEILRNDEFYPFPKDGKTKKIDLLFLIAMKSLRERFPSFFVEAK